MEVIFQCWEGQAAKVILPDGKKININLNLPVQIVEWASQPIFTPPEARSTLTSVMVEDGCAIMAIDND